MMIQPEFSQNIIKHYRSRGRHYPWRDHRTPYRVYLSEVLLQRTVADQVVPVYNTLVEEYPDIRSLLLDFDKATTIMKPLGRYVRLQYFRQGLDYLIRKHNGEIPAEGDKLLNIPGSGPYMTAAIRVFGFGIHDTIIDTNVVRLLGRIHGLQVNSETRRRKTFINLATSHVPQSGFVEYSYGLLDFAAEVCSYKKPSCDMCTLENICVTKYSRLNDCL